MPPDTTFGPEPAPSSSSILVGTAASSAKYDGESATWAAFAAAPSSEEFCGMWLMLQCSMVRDVRAALLLLRDDAAQSYVPAAIWPDLRYDVNYLSEVAQRVLQSHSSVTIGLDPQE